MHAGVKAIHDPVPNPNNAQKTYNTVRLLWPNGSHSTNIKIKVATTMIMSVLKRPMKSEMYPGMMRPAQDTPFITAMI